MCAQQFVELRKSHGELEKRGLRVIGLALEETDPADTKKFLKGVGESPPFPFVSDVGRKQTKRYEQTTAYLIDANGVVRQVFPMQTYARGGVGALLREIDRDTESHQSPPVTARGGERQ